jgi:L-alanine-DL-glutamate epimerase-like enolase superfamily enzyme
MEISDVETIEFSCESAKARDEKGHAHPGPPVERVRRITRVAVDGGPDGYCLGGHRPTNDLASETLAGEDPRERERIRRRLRRMGRLRRATLSETTVSRVDCALWDAAGKHYGEPVFRLLGGHRERVPAYASTMVGDDDPDGLGTPEAYADFAETLVDRGYPAVKLHTWMPPYDADPERVVAACRAVRDRVGVEVELMLDSHHFYARTEAKRIGDALADLGFAWFEEPMDEHSVGSYEWLTDEVDVPVVGPETAEGGAQTRAEWLRRDAADVGRVGVHDVGGITPALKAIHAYEAFGVECELHGGNLPNLHLLAAMAESGRYYERGLLHPDYDYEGARPYLETPLDPLDDDGRVRVPDSPGLGYDFDWTFVAENRVEP